MPRSANVCPRNRVRYNLFCPCKCRTFRTARLRTPCCTPQPPRCCTPVSRTRSYSRPFSPFPACGRADTSTRPQNRERPPKNVPFCGLGRYNTVGPAEAGSLSVDLSLREGVRTTRPPRGRPRELDHRGGFRWRSARRPTARSAARVDRTAPWFAVDCGRRASGRPRAARLDRAEPSPPGRGRNAAEDCPAAPPPAAGVSAGSAPRSRRAPGPWPLGRRARPPRLESGARPPTRCPPPRPRRGASRGDPRGVERAGLEDVSSHSGRRGLAVAADGRPLRLGYRRRGRGGGAAVWRPRRVAGLGRSFSTTVHRGRRAGAAAQGGRAPRRRPSRVRPPDRPRGLRPAASRRAAQGRCAAARAACDRRSGRAEDRRVIPRLHRGGRPTRGPGREARTDDDRLR